MPNLTHEQVSDAMYIAYRYHMLLERLDPSEFEALGIKAESLVGETNYVQEHRDMLRDAYQQWGKPVISHE